MKRQRRHSARRRRIAARCEQWWRLPTDDWNAIQAGAWRGPGSKRLFEFYRWLRRQRDRRHYLIIPADDMAKFMRAL